MDPSSIEPSAGDQQPDLLIAFLRDNDAACPVCRYNLRGLTRPVCPECKQDLALSVCVPRLTLAWLLVAIAPGFFSGIAAFFLCIPTIAITIEDGAITRPLAGAVLFGWCSGIFAIVLVRRRHRNRFIALSRARQRWIALTIWFIHFFAFVVFLFTLEPYI